MLSTIPLKPYLKGFIGSNVFHGGSYVANSCNMATSDLPDS